MIARPPSALALAVCAALLTACDDAAAPGEPEPRTIAWAVVQPASQGTVRSLPGVVRAVQRAELSFEVSGRVEAVAVDIGDHFEADQELARLEAHNYALIVQERESELHQAEASFAEASNDYDRQLRLYRDGWVAQAGYDIALSQQETAASAVEMARARLAIAREDLSDTVLEAPYAGTVAARLVEPSQHVAAGRTVFEIQSNGGGLEVEVAVPETLVDRLTVGSSHLVTFPTRRALSLIGDVSEIGSRAADGNAFPVTLTLGDAPADLRTGVTAEVVFDLSVAGDRQRKAVIPDTAFLAGPNDTAAAFVFDIESQMLSRREIVLAEVTGDRAIVSDGLEPGEIVAARGLPFLRDGETVERLGVGIDRYNP